jgi:superoxide dismutase, Cu-Zn family
MIHLKSLAAALVVASAGASLMAAQQPAEPSHAMMAKPLAEATADVAGEGVTGTATLAEYQHGDSRVVHVHLTVSGLKPGLHGVHLHAVGKCEAGTPSFVSAGGHFDPGPAGNPDPDANHPYHMGDLPNLNVGADGKGELDATTTRVTLTDGLLSLLDADGSAIIIHANPDQGITGEPKSGLSGGPRAACGVIKAKQ